MDEWINLTEDGGVRKRILQPGNEAGGIPSGSAVTVHYTGKLVSNGEKFDSSVDRGQPFQFSLGEHQVIKAWDIGVASMSKGERCELHCEPAYAYGEAGAPPSIPANATLVFEVELLDYEENPKEPAEIVAFCQRMKECGNERIKVEGRQKDALDCYRKGIEKMKDCPNFPEDLKLALLINAAIAASSVGDHRQATEYSRKALNLNPNHSKAAYRLAFALCHLGNWDEAISLCQKFESNFAEFIGLKNQIEQRKRQHEAKEREIFGRMFK